MRIMQIQAGVAQYAKLLNRRGFAKEREALVRPPERLHPHVAVVPAVRPVGFGVVEHQVQRRFPVRRGVLDETAMAHAPNLLVQLLQSFSVLTR